MRRASIVKHRESQNLHLCPGPVSLKDVKDRLRGAAQLFLRLLMDRSPSLTLADSLIRALQELLARL
jgi:hypothetical protein